MKVYVTVLLRTKPSAPQEMDHMVKMFVSFAEASLNQIVFIYLF